jgi:metallo-beta-lactamase class B
MNVPQNAGMRFMLALLLATSAFAQNDPVSRSWNQPVEPFRIIGNVHYVGASDITSFLITTPKGHILLDGGFVETAPMILANIKKLGFRVEDVKILIASHPHVDHAGGFAELKRATKATFYASRADIPQFARGGLDDPHFGNRFPFPPIHADRIIDDGSKISLGGTTLTARITPGHTPGCTTWTMQVRDKGRTHLVAFVGSPSMPSDYKPTPKLIAEYRKQFAILRSLPVDVFLGSHGNFFDLEAKRTGKKSFIDPAGYRAMITQFETTIETRARNAGVAAAGDDDQRPPAGRRGRQR